MRNLWRRHPRFTSFLCLIFLATLTVVLCPTFVFERESRDLGMLATRLQQSENIYQDTLERRRKLIRKFGPKPEEIALFPPDVAPWPPYTVWDFFPAVFNCPHETQRIGALGDGGKWVCGLSRLRDKENCTVYSFGVNAESSWEAELLSKTNHCQIWGYGTSFGSEIRGEQHRVHFSPYRLAGEDKQSDGGPVMYSLDTLMQINGHTFIDILRIDIEGSEFELAPLMQRYITLDQPLPFGQLLLEVHVWQKTFRDVLTFWELLEKAGLRPFMTEPNLVYANYARKQAPSELAEYSFINVKGDNVFIKDTPKPSTSELLATQTA